MDPQDSQDRSVKTMFGFTNAEMVTMIGCAVDRVGHPGAWKELELIWPLLLEKLEIRNLSPDEERAYKSYFLAGIVFGGFLHKACTPERRVG